MESNAPVVMTRPAAQSVAWSAQIRAAGLDLIELPLIDIRTNPDVQIGEKCLRLLDRLPSQDSPLHDVLFFSSPSATEHFLNAANGVARQSPLNYEAFRRFNVRAWVPGHGTAATLARLGFPPDRIDAPAVGASKWDSETLISAVLGQIRQVRNAYLIVGSLGTSTAPEGRTYVADFLRTSNTPLEWFKVYQREAPAWDFSQKEFAKSILNRAHWIFTSSDSLKNLNALLCDVSLNSVQAFVTHPRIGETATRLGIPPPIVCEPRISSLIRMLKNAQCRNRPI